MQRGAEMRGARIWTGVVLMMMSVAGGTAGGTGPAGSNGPGDAGGGPRPQAPAQDFLLSFSSSESTGSVRSYQMLWTSPSNSVLTRNPLLWKIASIGRFVGRTLA